MILLVSTSDKLQLVTDSAVTVDVQANYVDYASGTITPGRKNTLISTAATTDIVLAPAASTSRNVKTLAIRNRHASTPVDVTVQHTDGTNVPELYSCTLQPGDTLQYTDETGFFVTEGISSGSQQAYYGKLYAARGLCDPNELLRDVQNVQGAVNPTPTNITTSIARCVSFRPPADIVVNRIRYYGVGATTNVYRVALYRYSDLARLTAELAFTTAASTWGSIGSALNVTLSAGVLYFIAVAVNATGTTAGIMSVGSTTTAALGQIQSAPGALPGSFDLDLGSLSCYFFQFAVTTGALPNPAATLAQAAVWTGGFPAFWLDNVDT